MLNDVLVKIYERDLEKLRKELLEYGREDDLWKTRGEIANSAGNLALHLIGNLKFFIGAVIGNSGYVRDRDAEFSDTGHSCQQMVAEIDEAIPVIVSALRGLTADDFAAAYPIEVFGHPMTTEFFLIHLATHFNYHLGQINYHRRLIAGSET